MRYMAKILLVEDDLELAGTVTAHLEFEHHSVETVANGRDALHLMTVSGYDIIILDWGLPELNGIDVLKKFRSSGGTTPVLMLTGRIRALDKEAGLDTGADDYLTKPFEMIELTARIRALLRRPAQLRADVLKFGTIELDVRNFRCSRDGQDIALTSREFSVMEFFMRNPGQTFSTEAILERVWRSNEGGSLEGVRACIKRIRQKLDVGDQSAYLHSVRGYGYKLDHRDNVD